jgi:hypothetical protein
MNCSLSCHYFAPTRHLKDRCWVQGLERGAKPASCSKARIRAVPSGPCAEARTPASAAFGRVARRSRCESPSPACVLALAG